MMNPHMPGMSFFSFPPTAKRQAFGSPGFAPADMLHLGSSMLLSVTLGAQRWTRWFPLTPP